MATTKLSFLHSFIFLLVVATASALNDQPLNVGELTSSSYTTLLKTIRNGLGVTLSQNVPVLPVFIQTNKPPMFDVLLNASKFQVPVKVRADNLYVVGYQMQSPTPLWLEFGFEGRNTTRLITGSTFLELGEGYIALERAAGTNALSMSFTKVEFIKAVDELAVATTTAIRAKWLILMLTMIAESTRFADISNLLASNLNSPSSKLQPYMVDILVKNWEKFSTMVLRKEADPCYKYVPPIIQGSTGDTVEQLRNRFGIMYRDEITLKPPCTVTAALNDTITPMMELVAQA